MSTRCVVSFKQKGSPTFHVYKHSGGYPEGILPLLGETLKLAWPLPRYENDEFSAAFVATAKDGCGNVRLTKGPSSHGDLEYHYVVEQGDGHNLYVSVREVNYGPNWDKPAKYKLIEAVLLAVPKEKGHD